MQPVLRDITTDERVDTTCTYHTGTVLRKNVGELGAHDMYVTYYTSAPKYLLMNGCRQQCTWHVSCRNSEIRGGACCAVGRGFLTIGRPPLPESSRSRSSSPGPPVSPQTSCTWIDDKDRAGECAQFRSESSAAQRKYIYIYYSMYTGTILYGTKYLW